MKQLLAVLLFTVAAFAQSTLTVTAPATMSASTTYDAFGVPGLIKLPSGKVLSFFRHGATHINDHGAIMLRASTDARLQANPADWDAPIVFYVAPNNALDVRNVAGGVMADGSIGIIVLVMNYSLTTTANDQTTRAHNSWLMSLRSTDEGATWTAPLLLQKGGTDCTWANPATDASPVGSCFFGYAYGSTFDVPGGKCIFTLEFSKTTYPGNNSSFSTCTYDNGQSWGNYQAIRTPTASFGVNWGLSNAEGAMVNTHDDRLLLLIRDGVNAQTGAPGGSLYWCYSNTLSDHWPSLTWTCGRTINLPTSPVPANLASQGYTLYTGSGADSDYSPAAIDLKSPDGKFLLIVPERVSYLNSAGTSLKLVTYTRAAIFDPAAVIANPNGGFPAFQTIHSRQDELGAVDYGYPSAVLLNSGEILYQYHDEPVPSIQRAQIWTMRFRVECGGNAACQPVMVIPPPPPPPACVEFATRQVHGVLGQASHWDVCLKNPDETYSWRMIVTTF